MELSVVPDAALGEGFGALGVEKGVELSAVPLGALAAGAGVAGAAEVLCEVEASLVD